MREGGYHLPILQDPAGSIAGDYFVSGVPTAVAIDAQGRIVTTKVGATTVEDLVALAAAAR